jgi:DNA topoisomerase-1
MHLLLCMIADLQELSLTKRWCSRCTTYNVCLLFFSASFFAAMDPDGMHLGNPKTAPIFIKNFFTDFRTILGKNHIIKDFKKCDFGPIQRHLNEQKLIRKAITDEERKVNKDSKNETLFKFGYALVDGHLEKVGNYNMEPPGAFRGRGEHPKMGKLKQRVEPEQVMINVSEDAPVPMCSVPGHAWGEVRHDPTVQWLCQWKENINNQVKYMQLAAQSSFKGKSDRSKYNKAAKLCGNIDKIRTDYKKNLTSKSLETRQLATAMWVIDRLALRVGGEKDTDEEADTVGCCSLRVEHLKFDPNNEGEDSKEIELEFLGKDSMLFKQTIDFGSALYTENNGMGEQVYKNFQLFCKKKKPTDDVFSDLTPTILNAHLKSIMEGLTAKVFRTYNASKTLQDELTKTETAAGWKRLTAAEKVVEYNNANREVAILCNHQRSVSKAQETTLENLGDKLQTLNDQKKALKKILKVIMENSDKKIPMKEDATKAVDKAAKALEKAKKMKESAKTNEEKIAATEADQKAKELKKVAADLKFSQGHLWEKKPTKEQVTKRITAWSEKIKKMELNIKHKDDNKEVSLGTSKVCVGLLC